MMKIPGLRKLNEEARRQVFAIFWDCFHNARKPKTGKKNSAEKAMGDLQKLNYIPGFSSLSGTASSKHLQHIMRAAIWDEWLDCQQQDLKDGKSIDFTDR